MPLCIPDKCFRGKSTCKPLSSIESDINEEDGMPHSFICVGMNDGSEVPEDRQQDKYTVCWHNSSLDDMSFWDKRDLTDTASVLLQGLSAIENGIYTEINPHDTDNIERRRPESDSQQTEGEVQREVLNTLKQSMQRDTIND